MGTTAPATGTTATEAVVGVTPGPATGGGPQTPEEVPEDVLEESEEEPEMTSEPVPEGVPAEGAMIIMRVAAPSPSHSCCHGRCVRRGTRGGPRASHPLCAGRHSPRRGCEHESPGPVPGAACPAP
jgi:hypothetical protein